MTTASGALLYSRARVTRAWCGPGGYIQVGMRGCEPGGGVRAPLPSKEAVGPRARRTTKDFCIAIQAPSLGRERPLVARRELVSTASRTVLPATLLVRLVGPFIGGVADTLRRDTCVGFGGIHFSRVGSGGRFRGPARGGGGGGACGSRPPRRPGQWAQFGFVSGGGGRLTCLVDPWRGPSIGALGTA